MFGDYHINNKGFETHPGSELFKFSSGKFLPEEKRLSDGVPVYGGNGIAWYTDMPLINYPTIIIGRVGALCGNIHTVYEPVWITDNAIYIKEQKTDKFTLEFLTEMMTIMDFYQYADFSGQPKITQKPLETVKYLTPPIKMQNEFTSFCKQVDKSKVVVQQALEKAQLLFDSLMQKYFG
jgi:type I restriction enzyme S subunit